MKIEFDQFRDRLAALSRPNVIGILSQYYNVREKKQRIPNRVYQTWVSPRLTLFHALCVRMFRAINHDYSFVFFDDAQMLAYMKANYTSHPILDIFQSIRATAAKVDIWRYCILYKEGGIYCDIDSMLLLPLRILLKNDPGELIAFEGNKWHRDLNIGTYADPGVFRPIPPPSIYRKLDHPHNCILNWLMCFEKGHPILKEVIDLIVLNFPFCKDNYAESISHAIIHATGPLILTQAVWNWIERSGIRPDQYGIDFNGWGVFVIPWSKPMYRVSPHYKMLRKGKITH